MKINLNIFDDYLLVGYKLNYVQSCYNDKSHAFLWQYGGNDLSSDYDWWLEGHSDED